MRLVPLWRGRLGARCVYVCVLPVCSGFCRNGLSLGRTQSRIGGGKGWVTSRFLVAYKTTDVPPFK